MSYSVLLRKGEKHVRVCLQDKAWMGTQETGCPQGGAGLRGRRRETFTLILLYLLSLEHCERITYSKSVSGSTTNTNVT